MLNISRLLALLTLGLVAACVEVTVAPRGAPPVKPPGAYQPSGGGRLEVVLADVNGLRLSSNTHRCDVYIGIPNALDWQYAFGSFTPSRQTFRLSPHQWEIARSETRLVASFEVTQSYGRRQDLRSFTIWFAPRADYAEVVVRLPAWCRRPLRNMNSYDRFHDDGKFPYQRKGYELWY